MSEARYIVGDVFEEMAKLPDKSVDLVVTSPPFLALRSYLPVDHPDKSKEIGSEATPAAFLSTLLKLTAEWRRLLTPHGSIAVELGDTYSGSGGAGGDYNDDGFREGQARFSGSAAKRREAGIGDDYRPARSGRDAGWPLAKSLCGIPDAYMLSLIYGYNVLDPTETTEKWRVRNKIVWARPNPPVGALGDKVRPSTSYITVACISSSRWFDLDSERTRPTQDPTTYSGNGYSKGSPEGIPGNEAMPGNPAGAPLLDHWVIPTAPYTGSHYATFPPALPRRLINLMCPRQVCVTCGEPRRRIVDVEYTGTTTRLPSSKAIASVTNGISQGHHALGEVNPIAERTTLGWSDCGCPCECFPTHADEANNLSRNNCKNWRRGIVLDPFAGSGTTLMAASELGRDSIGIDLDQRNLDLARERCGMFLREDEPA